MWLGCRWGWTNKSGDVGSRRDEPDGRTGGWNGLRRDEPDGRTGGWADACVLVLLTNVDNVVVVALFVV